MKQIVVFCATTLLLVSGCASVVRSIHTEYPTTNLVTCNDYQMQVAQVKQDLVKLEGLIQNYPYF